jgi:hypothetical protein
MKLEKIAKELGKLLGFILVIYIDANVAGVILEFALGDFITFRQSFLISLAIAYLVRGSAYGK